MKEREKAIFNGIKRIVWERLDLSNIPELTAETRLADIFGIDLYGFVELSVAFRQALLEEYGEEVPEATHPTKTLGEIATAIATRLELHAVPCAPLQEASHA